MKTLFVSDLHLDAYTCLTDNEWILQGAFTEFADRYLTPAGRLCISGDLANYEGLEVAFLRFVSARYGQVYFVHGNHDLVVKREYPGRRFATSEERMDYVREQVAGCGNVHVLDGTVSDDGLVGGTMGMCDLSYRPEDQMEFDACGFWASTWFDGRTWNYCNQVLPDIMRREFGNLERICMAKPKIVMTHFCPMQMGVADEYNSDPKTAMFYFEAEKYLDMCYRDGKRPKFYKFLDKTMVDGKAKFSLKQDGSTDGYWKLLIDFKMYDNDGVGSPQMPVRPNFNMEEIRRMFAEYAGDHHSYPVANGIVDEFVSNYKEKHPKMSYSTKLNLSEYDSSSPNAATDTGIQYSTKLIDENIINSLNDEVNRGDYITTYKAMQLIGGKLYPPMAAKVKGENGKYQLQNASEIGSWQVADEDPRNIKFKKNQDYGYYVLNKGDGTSVEAAYNPYEHSSNLVLNDQFEGAYKRDNLVTVECVIPKSEIYGDNRYKAQYAKDSTGVLDWKSGVVAGKLKDNKRQVYLSRYLKPVRILPDSEVADMWKDTLSGSNVSVPFNVVSPQLLAELEKAGVSIDYEGSPIYKAHNKFANSTKLTLNGEEVELTDREEKLMEQVGDSYLKQIETILQIHPLKFVHYQMQIIKLVNE